MSRTSSQFLERTVSNLKIIEKYYPDNLEQALNELPSESDLQSVEDIDEYLGNLTVDLTLRLCGGRDEYFPGIDDEKLKRELCIPLQRMFEKNPHKLIRIGIKREEFEGKIFIHPLLAVFYEQLNTPEEIKEVIVNYGSKSLRFKSIDWSGEWYEPYIELHPNDVFEIFGDNIPEPDPEFESQFRANYRINIDPYKKAVIIDIFKSKPKRKIREETPPVEVPEEGFVQIKQTLEEKTMVGMPKSLTLLERCDEIHKLLGDFSPSSDIVLHLEQLAADLIGTYSDLDMGMEIANLCKEIREKVSPQRSLKEPDTVLYETKIIEKLKKVRSRLNWYATHVRARE